MKKLEKKIEFHSIEEYSTNYYPKSQERKKLEDNPKVYARQLALQLLCQHLRLPTDRS